MEQKTKSRLDRILKGLRETAKKLDIEPWAVNKAQFFQNVDDVTPWDIRIFGGLAAIQKSYFPQQDKDLAVIRQEKEITSYIRKLEEKASGSLLLDQEILKLVKESLRELPIEQVKTVKPEVRTGTGLTMELMLSDIHFGLKTSTINYKICRARLQKLTTVFLQEMERKKKEGYNVERIILALLGDIINSFSMHGLESAIGSEFGNSVQVQSAITSLYYDVILPIAKTGIPIFVPCVTGNHDRVETHRTMNDPGLNNLTWIIYNSLEEYCKLAGLKNVKFEITTASYIIHKIYQNNCLYEHGDNAKSFSQRAFETLMDNRARQNNVTIDFGRFGHWHSYVCFDRGRIIVNEPVGGQDSYAKVLGFNTRSGQTINFYVNTKNRPNCFYYSFPVDLS